MQPVFSRIWENIDRRLLENLLAARFRGFAGWQRDHDFDDATHEVFCSESPSRACEQIRVNHRAVERAGSRRGVQSAIFVGRGAAACRERDFVFSIAQKLDAVRKDEFGVFENDC